MSTETDTAALIQTVKDNARRLGLAWDVTMAQVSNIGGADPTNVSVIFDSDSDSGAVTAGVISMIGVLAPGERVYVMTVPPAGNYIIGAAAVFRPVAYGRRSAAKSGIAADSGLVGVEWTGLTGHMYYVTSTIMLISSTVNEILQFGITLRIAFDGTLSAAGVGTQFGSYLGSTIASTGGGAGMVDGVYTPARDQKLSVSTSVRRIVGAGTVTASDGAGGGPQIIVYDLGKALPNRGRTL